MRAGETRLSLVSPEARARYATFRRERWFRMMINSGDPILTRLACQLVLADPQEEQRKRVREKNLGKYACGNCGATGHNARSCQESVGFKAPSRVPVENCQRCGHAGHVAGACPWRLPKDDEAPDTVRDVRPWHRVF